MFEVVTLIESSGPQGQDRVAVIEHSAGKVVVVADGAGGMSGGADAAETLTLWVKAHVTRTAHIQDASQWGELLTRIDRQINFVNGQTTAVIVALSHDRLSGASVGDSAAWIIDSGDKYDDLTRDQIRKPLLGSGAAQPVVFERAALSGTLLVASDGLIKYSTPRRICEVALLPDLQSAAGRLADLVRLKSQSLPDDVGIALCRASNRARATPTQHERRRYTLLADGSLAEENPDN